MHAHPNGRIWDWITVPWTPAGHMEPLLIFKLNAARSNGLECHKTIPCMFTQEQISQCSVGSCSTTRLHKGTKAGSGAYADLSAQRVDLLCFSIAALESLSSGVQKNSGQLHLPRCPLAQHCGMLGRWHNCLGCPRPPDRENFARLPYRTLKFDPAFWTCCFQHNEQCYPRSKADGITSLGAGRWTSLPRLMPVCNL